MERTVDVCLNEFETDLIELIITHSLTFSDDLLLYFPRIFTVLNVFVACSADLMKIKIVACIRVKPQPEGLKAFYF